jgi:hypothetical protein
MQSKGKESTLQFDIAEDVRPSLAGVARGRHERA